MMLGSVRYDRRGAVALITLDHAPVNTLTRSVRKGLSALLERAATDDDVQAVVIHGAGKVFCGGADLASFETDGLAEPSLHTTINEQIESLDKPVVAAIHGVAVGGGLELALSCHYRVATPDAKLALPEITLGFIPGAGGTQKLPRAIGLERALAMILSGRSRRADDFVGTPLIDVIANHDLLDDAVAFALACADGRPLRRLRDIAVDDVDAVALLQFARRAVASDRKSPPGAQAAIDAVAKTLDGRFEDGMAYEFERFRALADSSASRALRHGFLAKAAARKVKGMADLPSRTIDAAAVIGAGLMGSGIAICLAEAGVRVVLIDNASDSLDRGRAAVARHIDGLVKRGRRTAEEGDALAALLHYTTDATAISDADLVIEAVFERLDVKSSVLGTMDAMARPGAVLASNTSSLDLNALASLTSRPGDVIGLHFFSPAQVMPLLEIVRGDATSDSVLATALALATRLKKTSVVAGVCDGFIGNRMIDQYTGQAFALLLEGASPEQIDGALERFGMAMGPLRMLDLVGNDVPWAVRKRQYEERPQAPRAHAADALCERGWFGQKTGTGWYRYVQGERRPVSNPGIVPMLESVAATLGADRRSIGDDEIVQRCILALVNEGGRLLDEGIAQRASDIDVVYLAGYGFPPQRGGPMFYADEFGLDNVIRLMRRFEAQGGPQASFWTPAPLLVRLAEAGGTLQAAIPSRSFETKPAHA